jgi:two-component system OmpR family response regulator
MPRICKVLVVEDHDGVRLLVGDALDAEGFRLTLVSTGAEARSLIEEKRFDVVILNVSLGDEDGFALAEAAARRGCGVILTTGDKRRFGAVRESGHPFVLKPFLVRALVSAVDAVLKSTNARCGRRKRRPSGP